MKSVLAGGFFLVSGSILFSAVINSTNSRDFIGWLGIIKGIIGVILIAIGLFVEED
ncbi:MAG: hypothetical protein GXZ01_09485 [Clostridiaceae bacterium]|jgi:cytochrome c biogenesis protein CcdA|nr:hypothetical protein [Clostridiaceae bacterium]